MDVWIICPNNGLIDSISDYNRRGYVSHKFGWLTEILGNNNKMARVLISCIRGGLEGFEKLIGDVLTEHTFQRIYLIDTCIGNRKNKNIIRNMYLDILVESAMFCGNELDYRRGYNGYRSPYIENFSDNNSRGSVISSHRTWTDPSIFEYAESYNEKIGFLDTYTYDFYRIMNSKRVMIPFFSILGVYKFMDEPDRDNRLLRAIQIAFLRVKNDIITKVRGTQRNTIVVPEIHLNPETKNEEDDSLECKICCNAKINSVFLPCGHAICCLTCANRHIRNGGGRSNKCMTCNQNIYNVNPLYLS